MLDVAAKMDVVGVLNCDTVVVGTPNCGVLVVGVLNCVVTVVVGVPNAARVTLSFIVSKPVVPVLAVVAAVTIVLALLAPNTNKDLLVDEVVMVGVPSENVGAVDNSNVGIVVVVVLALNEPFVTVDVEAAFDAKPKDLFVSCGSDVVWLVGIFSKAFVD